MSSARSRGTSAPAPTALEKVVATLEALARHDRVKDLAAETGLPPSTIHRILSELVELGWVQAAEHSYTPGPRLLSLVRRIDVDAVLAHIAQGPVARLSRQTGYTVHFGVLHGDVAVYVIKQEGRRAYLMRSAVGDQLALHRSAMGKAMLALMPEPQVREIAARTGLPAATPATITEPDALVEHLAVVRRRGWATDEQENEEHTRCVGAPVVDADGRPIAGVSLSALVFDLPRDVAQRMSGLVVATAHEISAELSSGSGRQRARASLGSAGQR